MNSALKPTDRTRDLPGRCYDHWHEDDHEDTMRKRKTPDNDRETQNDHWELNHHKETSRGHPDSKPPWSTGLLWEEVETGRPPESRTYMSCVLFIVLMNLCMKPVSSEGHCLMPNEDVNMWTSFTPALKHTPCVSVFICCLLVPAQICASSAELLPDHVSSEQTSTPSSCLPSTGSTDRPPETSWNPADCFHSVSLRVGGAAAQGEVMWWW